MQSLLTLTHHLLTSLPQLWFSLWALLLLLLAAVIVFMQYRRIALTESELYGLPLRSPLLQTQQSILAGFAGGIGGSILLSAAGVGLVQATGSASALLYLWPLSILLGALNSRLICFAYSGALLSFSHLLFGWPDIDVASVLGLIAMLHLIEALLIWVSGAASPTPLSFPGRGVGPAPGFLLQRYWPVPLVLPHFIGGSAAALDMPAWWPLLGPSSQGWEFLPLVVILGYSDLAIASPPEVRARQSSGLILLYSGALLGLAVAASYWEPALWLGAAFCGLGHEAMVVLSGRRQFLSEPFFRRPGRGVGVLDVIPGSPAERAGMRRGMVIVSVDDQEVHSRPQLHEALLSAPANVSIIFRNGRQLEHRRLPRPPEGYYGLGAILIPDPGESPMVRLHPPAFFRLFGVQKE